METESVSFLLENLKPSIIISCLRGDFNAQLYAHQEIIQYLSKQKCRLIFLSSANVFDAFTNFPSYEYDKSLSVSIYGKFKIKIENALLKLPPEKYVIARLPMVFGTNAPRIKTLEQQFLLQDPIEVFPNVIINATTQNKLSQQIHYIINQNKTGIFHLGSSDLIHHKELIEEFCNKLSLKPILKNVYDTNKDRYLAVLPKDNLLPENLQITIKEVINSL